MRLIEESGVWKGSGKNKNLEEEQENQESHLTFIHLFISDR